MAARNSFDLIIIGGGINGAGIARDAALRGISTCLLEQADICNGTTRWSSRLIHGGLRYLANAELGQVYESLRERETLLRIAPHLVSPLRLMIPIFRNSRRGRFIIGCGMWLYDMLSLRKSLPRHDMLTAEQSLEVAPGLRRDGLVGAATYYDAQVVFSERLVLENVLAAREAGADIRTYHRVDRILTNKRNVSGVRFTDLRAEHQQDLTARTVINASGPWVDRVLEGTHKPLRKFMGGTKGSHIIVPNFAGMPGIACYLEAESDGRPYFVIPWNGMCLIGTTDIRFDGNPADARAEQQEIEYLLDETNRFFPGAGLTKKAIYYSYTGVRPLPRMEKKVEGDITRKHIIKHHRRIAKGLYSVIGGKLTTYRHLAEEATNRIGRRLHMTGAQCTTATRPLPGAGEPVSTVDARLRACEHIEAETRAHLIGTYGSRSQKILDLVDSRPELADVICPFSAAIAAEIIFAYEHELATTLADVLLRRTMIGLSADQGRAALPRASQVAREHFGWSALRSDEEERRYLREIARLQPVESM
jgi:glycerol-3-phosphate dehydrogenase